MNELQIQENQVITSAKKGFLLIAGTGGQVRTIKKTEEGYLRCVSLNLKLTYDQGHFYCADKGNNDRPPNWQLTAEGLKYIAKHVGMEELSIDQVRIGERVLPNPYFEIDSMGKKSKVYAKSSVICRDLKGDYVITTATIMYDTKDALVTELLKAVKYDNSGKAGELLANDEIAEFRKNHKGYAVYEVDEMMSVLVNLKDSNVRQKIINYQNDKEMIDRKLVTMALRNAMKKHPAIGLSRITPMLDNNQKLVAIVPIVKWLDDVDADKENAINEYMASDKAANEFTLFHEELDDDNPAVDKDDIADIIDSMKEPEQPSEPPVVKSDVELLIDWIEDSPMDGESIQSIVDEITQEPGRPLESLKVQQLKIVKSKINESFGG